MSKKGQLQLETVSDFLRGELSRKEAAELLNTTERSITRIARRIEQRGILGVIHANRGKVPWNKRSENLKQEVMNLVMNKYYDFNMIHALETLEREHGLVIPYETFRRWCHEKKMVKREKKRRPSARYKRVRMPNEGMLLQLDGSPFRYNGKDEWCLIAAIDDATSDIPYAEFFASEDTLNCMSVIQKIIETKGFPYALYVDRAGCWGGPKRTHFNQFRRACEELNIRIIHASSPEAKGRIERAWGTIQDRLPPEMRIRNIRSMQAANHYLQSQFIPNYWRKELVVPAKNLNTKYRSLCPETDLTEILCLKEFRSVKRDHTLSWEGKEYLVPSPVKHAIWGQKIEIRIYQDLTWKSFFADRPLELIAVEKKSKNFIAA